MSRFSLALFIAALVYSGTAHADHVGIGTGPNASGPIVTQQAGTLAQGKVALGLSTEFVKSKAFTDAELIEAASHHVHAHSADYILTTSVNVGYGITDDIMVGLRLPYVYRDNIRSGAHSHSGGVTSNTAESHGDAGGLGDIMLMGKYRFLQTDSGFESAVIAALEMPTGETSDKNAGEKLEAEHQPGSGSWDPALGFAFSQAWNGFSFDASALYLWGTKGGQDTDLGDRATYGVSVSKRLGGEMHKHKDGVNHEHRSLDLVLELNGEWYGKQQEADVADQNSGGSQMFLSPGIRYTANNGWSTQLSVGVPIRNDFRQGHSDNDYKVTFGIGRAF